MKDRYCEMGLHADETIGRIRTAALELGGEGAT